MNKQEKKKAVRSFLDWAYLQKIPVVLAQKNQGILGQVPPQNIAALLDAWTGPKAKEANAGGVRARLRRMVAALRGWCSRTWARRPFRKG